MVRPFFIPALSAAVAAHLALFSGVVFYMRGTPDEYRIDLTFLGSILRRQDIYPQILPSVARMPVLEPSGLSVPEQIRAWEAGVILDKPLQRTEYFPAVPPVKFMTEKVTADDPETDVVTGIPDAPRIQLRVPQ